MKNLKTGLYDRLIYQNELEEINDLVTCGLATTVSPSRIQLREYLLNDLIKRIPELLDALANSDQSESDAAQSELQFISQLIKRARIEAKAETDTDFLVDPPRLLKSIHGINQAGTYPLTGLISPWLFSSSKSEPSLLSELMAELQSVDSVDILVSFITWSGVRKILDILKLATAIDADGKSRTQFRILTTTYIGATEIKAVNALAELPNVALKISLDGRRTRLHAKAWIFNRSSNFGTAFIGSANLSESALVSGIEWTVKLTQASNEVFFKNAQAHFETLWNDSEFQRYDPKDATQVEVLKQALRRESGGNNQSINELIAVKNWFDLVPKPYQKVMLEQLELERSNGRYRNLVVAATGTGKTVVSAFDYAHVAKQQGGQPKLLFVAHRVQILMQALQTFRQVLRDSNFGDLMDGNNEPTQYDHLFITINTLHSRALINQNNASNWYMVVVDEAHHLPAQTFDQFMRVIKPTILLGLTATPERMDGKSLDQYFDSRPDGSSAVSLRLWDALDQELLTPFEYYATHDNVDLTAIKWRNNHVDNQLDTIISASDVRANSALNALLNFASHLNALKVLGFCVSVKHAEFMANYFSQRGLDSVSITGQHTQQEREKAIQNLQQGLIKVIFTCDLFNEGVDIPQINTILLLRPTQSPVIFQQQIGRGLRLFNKKASCLVLDFIGSYAQDFRFDHLYRSLTGLNRQAIKDSVEKGFGLLPAGCHIQFDKVARERVLSSLKQALNLNILRLTAELIAWASGKDKSKIRLQEFLIDNQIDIDDIYSGIHYWSEIKRRAHIPTPALGDKEPELARRIKFVLQIDDSEMLKAWQYAIKTNQITDERRIQVFAHLMLPVQTRLTNPSEFIALIKQNSAVENELLEVIDWQLANVKRPYHHIDGLPDEWPLSLHHRYTRSDIITTAGYANASKRPSFREGCLIFDDLKIELMFVTLDKSEGFAARVAYHDYSISPHLFHWQTQNNASTTNKSGKRYLESAGIEGANGWRFYLFVRENRERAFLALGECKLEQHSGDKPISITWRLLNALPIIAFKSFSILKTI